MRKLCKFIGTVVSLSAIAFTAYTLYEGYMKKEDNEKEDDFDDFFEDDAFKEGKSAKREYVTIDIDKKEE